MPFAQLGLSQPILRALAKEGYETPTPIQAQCIPHVLEGKDLLGCAQTGTGKTAAFALPIIQRLMEMPVDKSRRGPAKARALILSPTRELAIQIRDSFSAYGRESGLRSTVIFGGVSQLRQVQALRDGVDIIIATPGRLIDLMDQRKAHLDDVKILVLDEADRMLDMGFIQPIRLIASKTPADRQTLLFSATMPPEIRKLADSLLKNPVSVAVSPVASAAPKIEQSLFHVSRADKQALLTLLLTDRSMSRVVVFTKTKHGAEKVGRKLYHAGVNAETIHGNKAQNARKKALDLFRAGKARVLVATDVAARGLDVDNISHVINFDLPMEPEAYIHRIGRTGRAGATGIAISFCDNEEKGLLKQIERLTKIRIPTKTMPTIDAIKQELRVSDAREYEAREADGFDTRERSFEAKPRPNSSRSNTSRSGAHRAAAPSRSPNDNFNDSTSNNANMDPRDRRKAKAEHAARFHGSPSPSRPNHASPTHASPNGGSHSGAGQSRTGQSGTGQSRGSQSRGSHPHGGHAHRDAAAPAPHAPRPHASQSHASQSHTSKSHTSKPHHAANPSAPRSSAPYAGQGGSRGSKPGASGPRPFKGGSKPGGPRRSA